MTAWWKEEGRKGVPPVKCSLYIREEKIPQKHPPIFLLCNSLSRSVTWPSWAAKEAGGNEHMAKGNGISLRGFDQSAFRLQCWPQYLQKETGCSLSKATKSLPTWAPETRTAGVAEHAPCHQWPKGRLWLAQICIDRIKMRIPVRIFWLHQRFSKWVPLGFYKNFIRISF